MAGVVKESLPGAVNIGRDCILVAPVGRHPGSRVSNDARHGAVGLAYAEYGPACTKILEEFSRQGGAVFGLFSQWKNQNGCSALLPDGGSVVHIAQIDQIFSEAGFPNLAGAGTLVVKTYGGPKGLILMFK